MMAWVANQMAKRGHIIHFVTFFSDEQARGLHENIVFYNLGVTQSNSRFIRNTTGMMKTIHRLHKYVKKTKPDIIVSFLDSVGYAYLPIARLFTKSKIVVSERVDPYSYKGNKAKLRFKLMKYAHGTVFQTKGARKFFKGKIYENSVVIPNPVVLSEKIIKLRENCPKYDERDNRIVTVGRLSLTQKRQDVLLDAFQILLKTHPELKLVIYGDGQDKDKIQALINQKGLADSVVLAGRTDNVEQEIFYARAFVLTSDFEGIPNALIEAMSVGVPSVSTDCSPGGAALLIDNAANGYLVPRGDAGEIAKHLKILVKDKNISEKFSKNSPQIIETYSENDIADSWEEYFKSFMR